MNVIRTRILKLIITGMCSVLSTQTAFSYFERGTFANSFARGNWLLWAPAIDASIKLYCMKHPEKFSNAITPEIQEEANIILKSLGKSPEDYEIKFITSPTLYNMSSFKQYDKVTNKTILYLSNTKVLTDSQHLNKYQKQLLKETIYIALTRPFVPYELLKALLPFFFIAADKLSKPAAKASTPYLIANRGGKSLISLAITSLISFLHVEINKATGRY